MSSVKVTVSGQRALTTTVNAPEMTSAFMPTKNDDKARFQVGNASEIRLTLPTKARLELVAEKKQDGTLGDARYLRLVVPGGGASLSVFVDSPEEGGHVGSWPHFNLDIGKHLVDYPNFEVVEVLTEQVGDLIPPTE